MHTVDSRLKFLYIFHRYSFPLIPILIFLAYDGWLLVQGFLSNFQMLFPDAKLLFIMRDPIATIWSMTQRQWGYSLASKELRTFSLQEHVENWTDCAEVIHEYAAKKNVYVCKFENLTESPEEESRRIFDFLELPYSKNFQPKQTSVSSFSEEDKEFILRETKMQREMIHPVLNR